MDFLPFSTIGGLAAVILGFGFIIFVHELGHFLVAKWVGIKCPQFAVGMGNAIFSWRKGIGFKRGSTEAEYNKRINEFLKREGEGNLPGIEEKKDADQTAASDYTILEKDRAAAALGLGETEYRLNWLPLGGYVKMLGQEDMDPAARSKDPRSFNSKPIWARACVISAGVVMNIIFGVLFFVIAFMAGVNFYAPVIGSIDDLAPVAQPYAIGHENDPAYKGGREGDVMKFIDGEKVFDQADVRIVTALAKGGTKLRLTVERERDGKVEVLEYDVLPEKTTAGLLDMGMAPPVTVKLGELRLTEETPERVAAQIKMLTDAGVKPGMKIISAGGKPVTKYHHYLLALAAGKGAPVDIVFEDAEVKEGETKRQATIKLSAKPEFQAARAGEDDIIRHIAGLVPATEILQLVPKDPAAEAGLKEGDVLVRIGSTSWPSTVSDIQDAIKKSDGGSVEVVVWRGKEEKTFTVKPKSGKLGIALGPTKDPIVRATHNIDSTSLKGILPGTRITKVNETPVETFEDLLKTLSKLAEASPKGFTVDLVTVPNEGKEPLPQTIKFGLSEQAAGELSHLDWTPQLLSGLFTLDMVLLKADDPIEALALGVRKTKQSMIQVYLTLIRVAEGTVHPKNFQGPVGIAHTGTRIAKQGWTYLMFFLGLISVNLAVVNFLPIPIVDGGHIIFLIIEKIKGSPVGPRIQTAAVVVGLAVLGCVFLYVTYNDIARLLGFA